MEKLEREDIGPAEDYTRLFRLKGIRLLINDIYIRVYPDYGFLILIKEGDYISFLHKKGVDRAAEEGLTLLGSSEAFEHYIRETRNYCTEYDNFRVEFFKKREYTKFDLEVFFKHIIKLLDLYKYTDYNFTEHAFEKALAANDQPFLERLEEMGRYKNEMRDYINKVLVTDDSDLDAVLDKLSSQHGISKTFLKEYTCEEMLSLSEGARVDEGVIAQRDQATAIFNSDGYIRYAWGYSALAIYNDFVDYEENSPKEIKGQVASPGIVRGYARVGEADYDDFKKLHAFFEEMKDGEILVCETTSPDLMPAMKKAAAFVTNQGGMISHAAIVSREFRIPCIVGTINGTKAIKTGDYIEVDANNGIIRILS